MTLFFFHFILRIIGLTMHIYIYISNKYNLIKEDYSQINTKMYIVIYTIYLVENEVEPKIKYIRNDMF